MEYVDSKQEEGGVFLGALFAIELSSTTVWREGQRFHVHSGKVREMTRGNMGIKEESDQLARRSEAQRRFESSSH